MITTKTDINITETVSSQTWLGQYKYTVVFINKDIYIYVMVSIFSEMKFSFCIRFKIDNDQQFVIYTFSQIKKYDLKYQNIYNLISFGDKTFWNSEVYVRGSFYAF